MVRKPMTRRSGWQREHNLVTVIDITPLVEERKRLQALENYWRTIFEAATEGLAVFDHGGITEANSAVTDLLGFTIDDFRNAGPAWPELIFQNIHARWRKLKCKKPYAAASWYVLPLIFAIKMVLLYQHKWHYARLKCTTKVKEAVLS